MNKVRRGVKMRRLSVIIVIALLAIMFLFACAPSQAPTPPPTETAPAPSGEEAATTPREITPSETRPSEPTPTPSPEEFEITIELDGAGKVLLTPSGGEYPEGTEVVLRASPKPGHEFDHWSGDLSGTSNPITITMDRNKSAIAHFEPIPTYILSVTVSPIRKDCDGGSVSLSPAGGTYESGTVVTLTALPSPDTYFTSYSFISWSGDICGTNSAITITMDSDKSVAASFKEIWVCPYCEGAEFDTIEELQKHISSEHPGERMPIIITWD